MIHRLSMTLLAASLVAGGTTIALAQDNASSASSAAPERQDDSGNEHRTTKRAGEIVAQPVHDIGIGKKEVPPILQAAAESPYAPPRGKGCPAVQQEMAALNAVLGPDFGQGTAENESKLGKVADVGGSAIVNSLIPFRGLVREVSGAAPADRRFAAAVSAGMARRGYLHGIAQRQNCGAAKASGGAKGKKKH